MKPFKTFALTLLLTSATLLGGVSTSMPAAHAMTPPPRGRSAAVHRPAAPNYTWQMFAATNASRRNNGLPNLILGRIPSRAAMAHCVAMANADSLYHSRTITPYLPGAGRVSIWGENIGWTTGGVPDLERAFMASPEHRPHILSRSFHHVAVGALRRGHRLWVTLFFYN
jgi:uncharacterized protein YkwD